MVLLALAALALTMKTGFPDAGDDSTGTTHRRAYDLLADGFGSGFNAPLLLVADLRSPGVDATAIPALAEHVAADPGIAMVGQPRPLRRGHGRAAHGPHHRAGGSRDVGHLGARPRPRPRQRRRAA